MLRKWSAVLLVFNLKKVTVLGWNIALRVTSQAGGAFGGEPFLIQPVVTIYNKQGELQSSFEGRVTVQLNTFPDGKYESVWKEGETVPTAASNTFVSEQVVNGHAVFTRLGIDAAGEGYQLKFVLHDENDLILGVVVGDLFNVEVGSRYKLGFIVHPEMAHGGSTFEYQPVLAIQDRGGNTVRDVNEGLVRC